MDNSEFCGEYQRTSVEGLDKFLKAIGTSFFGRQVVKFVPVSHLRMTFELNEEDNFWTHKIGVNPTFLVFRFKSGVPINTAAYHDDKIERTVTVQRDCWDIVDRFLEKELVVRERMVVDGATGNIRSETTVDGCDDVRCVQIFKRIE